MHIRVCIAPAIFVRLLVSTYTCLYVYSVEMVASRRKAYQCLGVVAVLGCVLLISRHFNKPTVVITSKTSINYYFGPSFILTGQLYMYAL